MAVCIIDLDVRTNGTSIFVGVIGRLAGDITPAPLAFADITRYISRLTSCPMHRFIELSGEEEPSTLNASKIFVDGLMIERVWVVKRC